MILVPEFKPVTIQLQFMFQTRHVIVMFCAPFKCKGRIFWSQSLILNQLQWMSQTQHMMVMFFTPGEYKGRIDWEFNPYTT